jgi:Mor family transcriptional regulator
MRKIDEAVRLAIMQDAQSGMKQKDLAAKHGVSQGFVSGLIGRRKRVSFEVARHIIASVDNGATMVDMSALYQLDYSTVQSIVRRRTKIAKKASESIYGG